MNRRLLAASTLATIPTLFAAVRERGMPALAQESQEISDQPVVDLTSLDGVTEIAQREFYLQASTLEDLASTEPLAVLTAAAAFENDNAASKGLGSLRSLIQVQLEVALGSRAARSKRTSAGSLGEETVGLDLQFAIPPDSSDVSVNTGIALVRIAAKVQFVIAIGFGGSLASSVDIASSLEEGWDSDAISDLLPLADAFLPRLPLRVELTSDSS